MPDVPALRNPRVRRDAAFRGLFSADEYAAVEAFYSAHPELPPTPLRSAGRLARCLGVGAIQVKDESARFGLSAFKITGAMYAVHRLAQARTISGLVCATAGNHGRAVARVARDIGVPCTVYVAAARDIAEAERVVRESRLRAMREDGARIIEVPGTYEDAVREAAAEGTASGATIVSDMSWEGYETIPRWIMAGYTRVFEEASRQWTSPPDLVLVQGGVGGLVCAAASWFAWRFGSDRPFIVACEPETAACLMESARAGAPTKVTGPMTTIMAGLRCAEPSPAAWRAIDAGVDAFMTVSDDRVIQAMEALRAEDPPIHAGPSGACGAAALMALMEDALPGHKAPAYKNALVVVTEGP